MTQPPTLLTARLILRAYCAEDAPDLQTLIKDHDIASRMAKIPHPYTLEMAVDWIGHGEALYDATGSPQFAVTLSDGTFIGGLGMEVHNGNERAEIGYWIGKAYWGRGYCTEAAQAAVKYGFDDLGLNRIFAEHMTRNPASGRVMQKLGMTHEGTLRQHVKKWGVFEGYEVYGILRSEYEARK